jgi:hypothetical protein
MPSPFAHSAAGYLIYRYIYQKHLDSRVHILRIPLALMIIIGFSLLPDLDVFPGIFTGDLGRFHNNVTHSLIVGLLVSAILSALVARIFRSSMKTWFSAFLFSYELHIIMDFFTGERGVMLGWPLTSARFTSPVKLFIGVKWGNGLISITHLVTILTEGLLFLLVLAVIKLAQRLKSKTAMTDFSIDKKPLSR